MRFYVRMMQVIKKVLLFIGRPDLAFNEFSASHLEMDRKLLWVLRKYPNIKFAYLDQSDADRLKQMMIPQLQQVDTAFSRLAPMEALLCLRTARTLRSSVHVSALLFCDDAIAFCSKWHRAHSIFSEVRTVVVELPEGGYVPVVQIRDLSGAFSWRMHHADPHHDLDLAIKDAAAIASMLIKEGSQIQAFEQQQYLEKSALR